MSRKSLPIAAAMLLAATSAHAQVADDGGFSGIYVGASGGYDIQGNDRNSRILFDRDRDGRFGDTVLTSIDADAFAPGFCDGRAVSANAPGRTATAAPGLPAGEGCSNDRDGWSYNGRVGFDRQVGSLVLGVVGEFGRSEIRDSVSGFSSTPANYVMTRSVDWEAAARLRAGYTPNSRTLFYATGGAGYARIDREFTTTNTANAFSEGGKRNQLGFQAGGGLEQRIGDNFSIGVEYLFHQYKDDDYRVTAGSNGSTPTNNPFILAPNTGGTDFRRSDDQFRWSSLRAVAAFRF